MSSIFHYFVNFQFARLDRVNKKRVLAGHSIFNDKVGSAHVMILEYGCAQDFGAVPTVTGLETSAVK